jgi:hypothetical protein
VAIEGAARIFAQNDQGAGTLRRVAADTTRYRQPALVGLSVVGLGFLVLLVLNFENVGGDAFAYWSVDLADLYGRSQGTIVGYGAFYYSPVLAIAFAPLGVLPWPVFLAGWLALAVACLAWLTGRWFLAPIALYPIAVELSYGNIFLVLAVALVAGLRYPAAWAAFPLTKVTPGIMWLWFAARGEWRNLAVVVSVTAALAGVSYLAAPGLWVEWIDMLRGNAGADTGVPVPLYVRLPIAAALIVWGARTDRLWVLPIALLLSMPTIWVPAFAVLAAIPGLVRHDPRRVLRGQVIPAADAQQNDEPDTEIVSPGAAAG